MTGIGSGMLTGVFPLSMSSVLPSAGALMLTNSLRMTQFTYNLITSCITRLIPLMIRIDKNNDMRAVREILQILTGQLYDARNGYYNAITKGSLQGCSGVSLMMGYSNPWAVLLRKQCEAVPLAFQGFMDLGLSILVEVPFTKCICVDAAAHGANFETYAMDNCYYFAPSHLKGTMMQLIQNAISPTGVKDSCEAMIQYTENKFRDSMDPFFVSQVGAFESSASAFDYLLAFIDNKGGKCTDFIANPYATVLLPEPLDYFSACGKTSLCRIKCLADISAFELAYSRDVTSTMTPQSTVISKTQESLMFMDLNLDAYTPMKIDSVVQLLDCSNICGSDESYLDSNGVNADTCTAIVGIATNHTIKVMPEPLTPNP
jgi:hypothetical protein